MRFSKNIFRTAVIQIGKTQNKKYPEGRYLDAKGEQSNSLPYHIILQYRHLCRLSIRLSAQIWFEVRKAL